MRVSPLDRQVSGVMTMVLVAAATVFVGVIGAGTPAVAACTHVASDFNGDGFSDMAAGIDRDNGGGLRILYGSSTGLTTVGNQFFDQNSAGMPAPLGFGLDGPIVTGYFNGDCYADVAIGSSSPQGDRDGLYILYGAKNGITTTNSVDYQISDLKSGLPPESDDFAGSLAAGDFDHDGYTDLAISDFADTGGAHNGGAVGVLYGSATGLTLTRKQWITQETPGVPGVSEDEDLFGSALAAADFTGDGFADLAIGDAGEDVGSSVDSGGVVVMKGSATGLTGTGAQFWDQSSSGVPGSTRTGDQFGLSLAAGDINHDGKADLAVGIPFKDVGSATDAGTVVILHGASAGLTGTGAQAWSQNSAGVVGTAETDDEFGFGLGFGDFNGDSHADLAIATPFEDIGSVTDAGGFTVLPGTTTGLTGTGSITWSQSTTGIPGTSEDSDFFGFAVHAGRVAGGSRDWLLVGDPGEDTGTHTDDGTIYQFKGSSTGLTTSGNTVFSATNLQTGIHNADSLGSSLG